MRGHHNPVLCLDSAGQRDNVGGGDAEDRDAVVRMEGWDEVKRDVPCTGTAALLPHSRHLLSCLSTLMFK